MSTPPERRHRLLALVGALVVLAALTLVSREALAQPCPNLLDPACTTTSSSTSTTEDEPTTTTERTTTSSSSQRTTTTTDDVAATVSTVSTVTVSTVNDLLVPGDGTEGAESTTTSVALVSGGASGLSDDQLLLLIVCGLAVVAMVGGLLTWRYWSATRPVVVDPPPRPRSSR